MTLPPQGSEAVSAPLAASEQAPPGALEVRFADSEGEALTGVVRVEAEDSIVVLLDEGTTAEEAQALSVGLRAALAGSERVVVLGGGVKGLAVVAPRAGARTRGSDEPSTATLCPDCGHARRWHDESACNDPEVPDCRCPGMWGMGAEEWQGVAGEPS